MPDPIVGMIVPPADGAVPPEAPALYPQGVAFIADGLALPRLTPEGYGSVVGKVGAVAAGLKRRGASAVALMGTSLSFFRGAAFNRELVRTMQDATGLPVTTMSNAVLEALRAVGARRVAVGTAYNNEVNRRLRDFLAESGVEVLGLEGMGLERVEDILAVTDADLLAIGERAHAAAPEAEALFISCGGLRTLDVTMPLEERFGLPVITSATAGAWAAVRLVGHSGRAAGYGRLLEMEVAMEAHAHDPREGMPTPVAP